MTERTTSLYEILIRFNEDGFQGAHVKDLETIREGAEVLLARESDPRPVTLKEVGEHVGKESAKLIEAADAARALAKQHEAAANDAVAKVESAEVAALARAEAAEADAKAKIETAEAVATARIAAAVSSASDRISAAESAASQQVSEAQAAQQQAETALERATASLRQALGHIAPENG